VKVICKALIKIITDAVVSLSYISKAQRELQNLNALEKITSIMFNQKIICISNKIQKT